MKRLGWGALAVIVWVFSGLPTSALDTVPSSSVVVKVSGPLLMTGLSFSGQALRYLQVYNASDEVVPLDGWQVASERSGVQTVYASLAGNLAPKHYATIANVAVLPSATFLYAETISASDPVLSSVSLLAPVESSYNNEIMSPAVVAATPRVSGTPATFYYARNVSAVTGNYLATFTAFLPLANFTLVSDGLYEPPRSAGLNIVEIYPDATACSPFESAPTCSDYVKLRNDTQADIDLADYRVRTGAYGQASTASNTVRVNGVLPPGRYASVPIALSSTGGWVWLEDAYGTVRYEPTLIGYPSGTGHDFQAWSYNDNSDVWRWTIYPSPLDEPNRFETLPTINQCAGVVLSEIAANVATEDQYIEIMNVTDQAVDLNGCALQTNRSSKTFVFGPERLEAKTYRSIYIKDTDLTLTKTTSGSVYLLSSDLLSEQDQADYDTLAENTAWARIADTWQQTFSQTPGSKNVWQEYPACEQGYSRNIETGLCNKIQATATTLQTCEAGKVRSAETNRCRSVGSDDEGLAPCGPDQYRNPETNRCRSLLTTASILAPCAANQERSPETNRCRSVGTDTELKPCAANQERNPETNRCRNKASAVTTDFPVEAVAQSTEATLGWWAFGGVGMLAVGYASWEWRREVLGWIGKIVPFGIGRP